MEKKSIYRIVYVCNNTSYEMYAKEVSQSHLFGFIQIGELLFNEQSGMLVDPSEERLKTEMAGVNQTHIPLQSILRIDEVEKQGQAKIKDFSSKESKVTAFPGAFSIPVPPKD